MLRAAATFLGLLVIWLLLTQRFGAPFELMFAALAALSAMLIGSHFAAGVSPVFVQAPGFIQLAVSRAGAVLEGCLSTLRAALAADVSLAPALARLRTRSSDEVVRAELANLISAAPGGVVVDADAEGLLIHLINEDGVEAGGYAALEAAVTASLGTGPQP
jgi:multisubunit Na+/H+ antiporter MnhE subunit